MVTGSGQSLAATLEHPSSNPLATPSISLPPLPPLSLFLASLLSFLLGEPFLPKAARGVFENHNQIMKLSCSDAPEGFPLCSKQNPNVLAWLLRTFVLWTLENSAASSLPHAVCSSLTSPLDVSTVSEERERSALEPMGRLETVPTGPGCSHALGQSSRSTAVTELGKDWK